MLISVTKGAPFYYLRFMKQFRPLFYILFICNSAIHAQTGNPDEATKEFANQFTFAVAHHDYDEIWKFLDKDYRKTQKKFLSGDKKQLMDELFSGEDGKKYVSLSIDSILKIKIAEVTENEDGSFSYIFRVRDERSDIMAYLRLVTHKKKLGFIGALG